MSKSVSVNEAKKWIGQEIVAVRKDGTQVAGKLVSVSGNKLILEPLGGKEAGTRAIIPLVLFDLLAIGTLPFIGGGGFGGPFGGGGYQGGYNGGGYQGGGYPGGGYGYGGKPGGGYGFGPGPGPGPGPGFGGGYGYKNKFFY
ncbi:hypothetical protein [Paenibacillus sp. Marseille-Q7038]